MAQRKRNKTKYPGVFSYETKQGLKYSIRVKYQDIVTGKWKERTESGFDTIKRAKSRQTELERMVLNDLASVLDADKMTFKEWYKQYYEMMSPTWTADSRAKVDGYYNNHFFEFNNTTLSKLNLTTYQKFINRKLFEDDLSAITVKAMNAQFMAIINMAVRHEILQRNRLSSVSIQKEYTPKKKAIEIDKLLEFDRVAKQTYDVMEYGMYVLTRIGWRRGEVMGFSKGAFEKISDDVVDVSVIKTRTTKTADEGKGAKTQSSYRTNRLRGEMAHAIIDAVEFAEKVYKRFNIEWDDDSFVFVNYKDCVPFFPTHLGRILSKVSKITGIKVTPHMFRHTFVTLALERKNNPVEIARWVGHSKIDMTLNTYSHATEKTSEEIVEFANDSYLE